MSQVMTPIERVEAALHLQEPDRVPCCVSMSYWIARDAGISIAEYITNDKLRMELSHKMFDRLGGFDFIEMFYRRRYNTVKDITSMPMRWKVPGKDLPADSIPQGDEVELMPPEGYDSIIRKGWVRYIKEDLYPSVFPEGEEKASLISEGEITSAGVQDKLFYEKKNVYIANTNPFQPPFQVLSYARSMGKFMVDLFRRPEKVVEAMNVMQPELVDLALNNFKQTGAILLAGSRCSNGFLSPQQFEKFAFPYFKNAVEIFVNRGYRIFFHLDQNWTGFLPYFKEFPNGIYRLHFDGMTDIFKAKSILGDRMCLMGDIPAPLFRHASADQMETYCRKLIEGAGKGGGLIVSAGCTTPDDAKFENVKAMIDAAHNYEYSR